MSTNHRRSAEKSGALAWQGTIYLGDDPSRAQWNYLVLAYHTLKSLKESAGISANDLHKLLPLPKTPSFTYTEFRNKVLIQLIADGFILENPVPGVGRVCTLNPEKRAEWQALIDRVEKHDFRDHQLQGLTLRDQIQELNLNRIPKRQRAKSKTLIMNHTIQPLKTQFPKGSSSRTQLEIVIKSIFKRINLTSPLVQDEFPTGSQVLFTNPTTGTRIELYYDETSRLARLAFIDGSVRVVYGFQVDGNGDKSDEHLEIRHTGKASKLQHERGNVPPMEYQITHDALTAAILAFNTNGGVSGGVIMHHHIVKLEESGVINSEPKDFGEFQGPDTVVDRRQVYCIDLGYAYDADGKPYNLQPSSLRPDNNSDWFPIDPTDHQQYFHDTADVLEEDFGDPTSSVVMDCSNLTIWLKHEIFDGYAFSPSTPTRLHAKYKQLDSTSMRGQMQYRSDGTLAASRLASITGARVDFRDGSVGVFVHEGRFPEVEDPNPRAVTRVQQRTGFQVRFPQQLPALADHYAPQELRFEFGVYPVPILVQQKINYKHELQGIMQFLEGFKLGEFPLTLIRT